MDVEYDYTKILKQLVFSYLVNAIVFIVAPLGTVVLSRALSVAEFGVYALFFSWWNVGMHLGSFGLNMFMQNYLPGRSLSEQEKIVGGFFKFVFLATCVFGVLWFFLIGQPIMAWLKIPEYFLMSSLVIFAIIVSATAIIPHVWLGVLERLNVANFLYGVNSTVWIFLSAGELFFTGGLVFWRVILYWIIGALIQLAISVFKLGRSAFHLFNESVLFSQHGHLVQGLLFGLPLLPVVANQWVMTVVDRVLLARIVGPESVGVYSLLYALVGIIGSFSSLVVTIFYPYVAKAWNTKNYQQYDLLWNAVLKYVIMLVLPGMVGMVVLPQALVMLLGGSKFVSGISVVNYLVFFPLFWSLVLVFQMALLVRGRSIFVGVTYLIGFVLNAFLSRLSVPYFGIKGAASATVVSYLFVVIIFIATLRKEKYLHWNFLKFERIFLAALLMGGVISFFKPQLVVTTLAVVGFGAFVYFFFCLFLGVFGKEEITVLKNILIFRRRLAK